MKGMVGYIYMDLSGAPPELKNLTFLDNLESLVWETQTILESLLWTKDPAQLSTSLRGYDSVGKIHNLTNYFMCV
ncbi:unnamed protein product [Echinostoma caproni]|uniref:Uncharacterized protein n=1 Tax=Echinostoma caproni TaxID=27848 RepID=A0A3P8L6Q3_9TREM|nr:unnamed protein product [Echinostoma caproni]